MPNLSCLCHFPHDHAETCWRGPSLVCMSWKVSFFNLIYLNIILMLLLWWIIERIWYYRLILWVSLIVLAVFWIYHNLGCHWDLVQCFVHSLVWHNCSLFLHYIHHPTPHFYITLIHLVFSHALTTLWSVCSKQHARRPLVSSNLAWALKIRNYFVSWSLIHCLMETPEHFE